MANFWLYTEGKRDNFMRIRSNTGRRGVALFVAVATAMATLAAVNVIQPAQAVETGAGRPDNSFDQDGLAITNMGSGADDVIAVEFDAARRAVVLIENDSVSADHVYVARFTTSGQPDLSFGQGGVRAVVLPLSFGSLAIDLALDSAGRIIVVAYQSISAGITAGVVVRLLPTDGSNDTSFAGDGVMSFNYGSTEPQPAAVAIDSADRIVVAGSELVGAVQHGAITRINTDGTVDLGFGTNGVGFQSDISDLDRTHYADVAVDPVSSNILAVGYATNGSDLGDAFAHRFDLSGTFDPTYPNASSDGRFDFSGVPYSSPFEMAHQLAVASDGSGIAFVVASTNPLSDNFGAVVRLDAAGDFVTGFGTGGITRLINRAPTALRMPDPDSVVVTGYKVPVAGSDFFIGRLDQSGAPDTSFGAEGEDGFTDFGSTTSIPYPDLAIDGVGAPIVVTSDAGEATRLHRFTPDLVPGPRAATKVLFTEDPGPTDRHIFGMSPDGSDIVGLSDGGDDTDHFDPSADLLGQMHYSAGGSVWRAYAASGLGAVDGVSGSGPGIKSSATTDAAGTLFFLSDGCVIRREDFGSYTNLGAALCNVTRVVSNPGHFGWIAFIQNGNLFTWGPNNPINQLTTHGAVTHISWGFDGNRLAYTVDAPEVRQILMVTSLYADQNFVPPSDFGPAEPLQTSGGPAFTGVALAPDASDASVIYSMDDGRIYKYGLPENPTSTQVLYTGTAPIVSSWNRNLGIHMGQATLEPFSIDAEDVPLQGASPAAQQANPEIQAAGIAALSLLKSPIAALSLLKSPIAALSLLKSPIAALSLLKSGLAGLSLLKSPLTDQGLDRISLSQMPIVSGPSWKDRLLAVGTPEAAKLAALPLQQVSLGDLLALDPTPELPSLEQLDLSQGLFGTVSVLPFLLGGTQLRDIGGIDWCAVYAARNAADCGKAYGGPGDNDGLDASLLSLQIAGFDLDNLVAPNDLRTITFDQVDVDDEALLGNLVVRELDLFHMSIGSALVKDIKPDPNAVVDCQVTDCTTTSTVTLHQAKSAGAFRVDAGPDPTGTAVLSQLGDALDGYRLNELALGAWGVPGDDPYDQTPEALGITPQTADSPGTDFSAHFAASPPVPARR